MAVHGTIRIADKDKLAFIGNLATMLGAGIPILEAIDSLQAESTGSSRRFLGLMHDMLSDGRPLSEAFAAAPQAFDPVTVNLIKAGEEAGTLEASLRDIARNIKRETAFRDHLRSSLTYPAFVMATFAGVLLLILTFVVPRLSKVFSGLRVELPAATRLLIQVSDLLLAHYLLIIGLLAGTVVLVVALYRAKRRAVINALLSLPMLRKLGLQIDLTRFTHSLGTLLRAGVPIVDALELSEDVTTKPAVRAMVRDCRRLVTAGQPLSEGMRLHKAGAGGLGHGGVVPAMMIQIVEAAEASGTVDTTMQELSRHFETQVRQSLKTFATLIEPVALVVVGVLVGGMMLAVIAPIYGLINQIRTR